MSRVLTAPAEGLSLVPSTHIQQFTAAWTSVGLLPYLHLARTNPYKTNSAEDLDSVSECPVIHGTTILSPPKSRVHQKRSGKNVKAGGRAEGRADV